MVIATDENVAIDNLKTAIGKLGNDYWVNKILSVEEFKGTIFTRLFGIQSRKENRYGYQYIL